MKKVLVVSLLLVGASYADVSFAQHEAQMKQMQERTQQYNSNGNKEQKKHQYKYGSQNQGSGSGSQNMYQGSHGKGGGKR